MHLQRTGHAAVPRYSGSVDCVERARASEARARARQTFARSISRLGEALPLLVLRRLHRNLVHFCHELESRVPRLAKGYEGTDGNEGEREHTGKHVEQRVRLRVPPNVRREPKPEVEERRDGGVEAGEAHQDDHLRAKRGEVVVGRGRRRRSGGGETQRVSRELRGGAAREVGNGTVRRGGRPRQ